ncbi:MAG: deoxyribose-phosphate aldolase [Erysipelotrichaceae bacterium]
MVDVVELSPSTTMEMVNQLVDNACKYEFHSIGVPYCYHPFVISKLKEKGKYGKIKLLGGAGFPDGNWPTDVKIFSVKKCIEIGCNEIDLTSNVGWIKSGMWEEYRKEIKKIRELTMGMILKVIIHSPILSEKEIKRTCEILIEEKVDYIKTDTGRSNAPTTVSQIEYIKEIVGNRCKIKASGGVRTLDDVIKMKEVGAERFGMNHKAALSIFNLLSDYGE